MGVHHLSIHLSPSDPMALERVLMTCRIRRCDVVSMRYESGLAEIALTGVPRRVAGLVPCLDRLVGVLTVTIGTDPGNAP